LHKIDIKPLSVNDAWKGRRFRTDSYNKYIRDVLLLLKPCKIPDCDIELNVKFGFSSYGSDIDNPLKPFIDCLQKKYGFNDNKIKRLLVETEKVRKGKEFIEWSIKELGLNSK